MCPDEDKSDACTAPAPLDGNLDLCRGGKWSTYYFCLSAGGIYYYKDSKKLGKYVDVFKLLNAKVEAAPADTKRPHAFAIKIGENQHVLSAPSEESMNAWKEAITKSIGLGLGDGAHGKKKQSRMMAMKKNIASKAATSSLVQSVLSEVHGKDSFTTLMKHNKNIMKMHYGKKHANELMESIYRLVAKVILLYQSHDILESDLSQLFMHFHKLWSLQIDFIELPFAYDVQQLQVIYQNVQQELCNLVKDYVSDKTVTKVERMIADLSGTGYLNFMYTDPRCEKDREGYKDNLRADWMALVEKPGGNQEAADATEAGGTR